MTNANVIAAFFSGGAACALNLTSTGKRLYSYAYLLAVWEHGSNGSFIWLNADRTGKASSQTTSRHRNAVRDACKVAGIPLVLSDFRMQGAPMHRSKGAS